MSINVETSGRTGFCGEHSPAEALVPTLLHDYVLKEPVDVSAFDSGEINGGIEGWERLEWVVDEGLEREIEECEGRNQALIEDSDASQLWWREYGVEWIKQHGTQPHGLYGHMAGCIKLMIALAKLSPDAYIQQALQLAWYMDQGYASATYETASTRSFLHGRTDVIRTLSSDSRAFVKSMLDPESNVCSPSRYSLSLTQHRRIKPDMTSFRRRVRPIPSLHALPPRDKDTTGTSWV
jgi:carnitine O-acetyltransferase